MLRTKNGLFEPGGTISIYGGSHDEVQPSASYGGSTGDWNYFVAGDYIQDNLGIESPDGSADPLHEQIGSFADDLPPGHVVLGKLRQQVGETTFAGIVDHCVAAQASRPC